jgi:hypothetical protein
MKKVSFKSLQFTKETVSNLKKEDIKDGASGFCTSSVDPYECYFQCATGYAC